MHATDGNFYGTTASKAGPATSGTIYQDQLRQCASHVLLHSSTGGTDGRDPGPLDTSL